MVDFKDVFSVPEDSTGILGRSSELTGWVGGLPQVFTGGYSTSPHCFQTQPCCDLAFAYFSISHTPPLPSLSSCTSVLSFSINNQPLFHHTLLPLLFSKPGVPSLALCTCKTPPPDQLPALYESFPDLTDRPRNTFLCFPVHLEHTSVSTFIILYLNKLLACWF